MKKLLKQYGFTTREQYFDMCIESHINGQRAQAREQFKALTRAERQMMLKYTAGNQPGDILAFFIECI